MVITAVQAIRRMRGGSQSQLMLGADKNLWVVKFQNNPQHRRVLANELLVTGLAAATGLSVPEVGIIKVIPWLVDNSPGLDLEFGRGRRERCEPGAHFGSRFVGTGNNTVVDYLVEEQLEKVVNIEEFAGILALDKWTSNCDGRQAVFSRKHSKANYRATFIDQGFCFNCGEWNFPDSPLRGVYGKNTVYAGVTGWESFSPWLERFEEMSLETIWSIAEAIPSEWFEGDMGALDKLVELLVRRRSRIRDLITSFRQSERNPFPLWSTA